MDFPVRKHELVGSKYLIAAGKIRFQGPRTDTLSSPYSEYIVVHKDTPIDRILTHMRERWDLYDPDVLFSVTGGADLSGMPPQYRLTFNEGFAAAAGSVASWVVTGGSDRGVMRMVGDAVTQNSVEVPCIGIATLGKMVGWKDLIRSRGWMGDSDTYDYDTTQLSELAKENSQNRGAGKTATEGPDGTATLNSGHSHFILVHSMEVDCEPAQILKFKANWGDENDFRERLEAELPRNSSLGVVPVQLVVSGGPETMKTVSSAVHAKIPIIIFNGTGRAADLLSELNHHAQQLDDVRAASKDQDGRQPGKHFPSRKFSRLDSILLALERLEAARDIGLHPRPRRSSIAATAMAAQAALAAAGGGTADGPLAVPGVAKCRSEGDKASVDPARGKSGGGAAAAAASGTEAAGGGQLVREWHLPKRLPVLQGDLPNARERVIDSRVFQPLQLSTDWGAKHPLNVWIPRFLFEWMVSLPRPPSPEEYFGQVTLHCGKGATPRSTGSFVFRHVYSTNDLIDHEMLVLEKATDAGDKLRGDGEDHFDRQRAEAQKSAEKEKRHARQVIKVLKATLHPDDIARRTARKAPSAAGSAFKKIEIYKNLAKAQQQLDQVLAERKQNKLRSSVRNAPQEDKSQVEKRLDRELRKAQQDLEGLELQSKGLLPAPVYLPQYDRAVDDFVYRQKFKQLKASWGTGAKRSGRSKGGKLGGSGGGPAPLLRSSTTGGAALALDASGSGSFGRRRASTSAQEALPARAEQQLDKLNDKAVEYLWCWCAHIQLLQMGNLMRERMPQDAEEDARSGAGSRQGFRVSGSGSAASSRSWSASTGRSSARGTPTAVAAESNQSSLSPISPAVTPGSPLPTGGFPLPTGGLLPERQPSSRGSRRSSIDAGMGAAAGKVRFHEALEGSASEAGGDPEAEEMSGTAKRGGSLPRATSEPTSGVRRSLLQDSSSGASGGGSERSRRRGKEYVIRSTIKRALEDLKLMDVRADRSKDGSQEQFTKVWPMLMRAMQAVRLGTVVAANLEQLTKQAQDTRDKRREIAEMNRHWQQAAVERDRIARGWAEGQFAQPGQQTAGTAQPPPQAMAMMRSQSVQGGELSRAPSGSSSGPQGGKGVASSDQRSPSEGSVVGGDRQESKVPRARRQSSIDTRPPRGQSVVLAPQDLRRTETRRSDGRPSRISSGFPGASRESSLVDGEESDASVERRGAGGGGHAGGRSTSSGELGAASDSLGPDAGLDEGTEGGFEEDSRGLHRFQSGEPIGLDPSRLGSDISDVGGRSIEAKETGWVGGHRSTDSPLYEGGSGNLGADDDDRDTDDGTPVASGADAAFGSWPSEAAPPRPPDMPLGRAHSTGEEQPSVSHVQRNSMLRSMSAAALELDSPARRRKQGSTGGLSAGGASADPGSDGEDDGTQQTQQTRQTSASSDSTPKLPDPTAPDSPKARPPVPPPRGILRNASDGGRSIGGQSGLESPPPPPPIGGYPTPGDTPGVADSGADLFPDDDLELGVVGGQPDMMRGVSTGTEIGRGGDGSEQWGVDGDGGMAEILASSAAGRAVSQLPMAPTAGMGAPLGGQLSHMTPVRSHVSALGSALSSAPGSTVSVVSSIQPDGSVVSSIGARGDGGSGPPGAGGAGLRKGGGAAGGKPAMQEHDELQGALEGSRLIVDELKRLCGEGPTLQAEIARAVLIGIEYDQRSWEMLIERRKKRAAARSKSAKTDPAAAGGQRRGDLQSQEMHQAKEHAIRQTRSVGTMMHLDPEDLNGPRTKMGAVGSGMVRKQRSVTEDEPQLRHGAGHLGRGNFDYAGGDEEVSTEGVSLEMARVARDDSGFVGSPSGRSAGTFAGSQPGGGRPGQEAPGIGSLGPSSTMAAAHGKVPAGILRNREVVVRGATGPVGANRQDHPHEEAAAEHDDAASRAAVEDEQESEHRETEWLMKQLVRRLKLAVQWECEDVVQAWVAGVCRRTKQDGVAEIGAAAVDKPKRMAMEAALAYAALRDNDRIARVFLDESVRVDIASVDLVCLSQLMPGLVDLEGYSQDAELVRRMAQSLHNDIRDRNGDIKRLRARLSGLKKEFKVLEEKKKTDTMKGMASASDVLREQKAGGGVASRPAAEEGGKQDEGPLIPGAEKGDAQTAGDSKQNDSASKRGEGSRTRKGLWKTARSVAAPWGAAARRTDSKTQLKESTSTIRQDSRMLEDLKKREEQLQAELKAAKSRQLLPVRLLPGRHWLEDLALRLHPHVSREFPRTALDAALVEARMTSCKLEEALESVRVVWALVNRRFRIARLFWRHCSQPLRVALYAAQVLRLLAEVDDSSRSDLNLQANNYETMAIELFSLAGASRQIGGWENSDWKDAALWLRSTAQPSWIINDIIVYYHAAKHLKGRQVTQMMGCLRCARQGLLKLGKLYKPGSGKNMIRLAQQGRCQRFIGHPIVQRVLENLWMRGSWVVDSLTQPRRIDQAGIAGAALAGAGLSGWMGGFGDTGSGPHLEGAGDKHNAATPTVPSRDRLALDVQYGMSSIGENGIALADARREFGEAATKEEIKLIAARKALEYVAVSLDDELGRESIVGSRMRMLERSQLRRRHGGRGGDPPAELHRTSQWYNRLDPEQARNRRQTLVHRLALERRFENDVCQAAVDLRKTQADSQPGGTMDPLLASADSAISTRWIWHCCACCWPEWSGEDVEETGALGRLEYVNVLRSARRGEDEQGVGEGHEDGMAGLPHSLSVRGRSSSGATGVLLPAGSQETGPSRTSLMAGWDEQGTQASVFRLPPVSSTSVVTNYGQVATVSALQELEDRRLRLERARETHQVLDVNRKAMEYRRSKVQAVTTRPFKREGPSQGLDEGLPPVPSSTPGLVAQAPGVSSIAAPSPTSEKGSADDDSDESHVGWEYQWACSPHWKFVAHSISRLLLTCVHAALVVSQNSMQAQFLEVLFYVWMFSQCAEDVVGMYYQGFKQAGVWDIFGLLDYGAAVAALVLRLMALVQDDDGLLDYAWDVLSLSFIIASIRLLDVLAVIRYFGPLVITISRILLRDILMFLVLLLLFLGGFAVAITAIFVVRNPETVGEDGRPESYQGLEDLLWSVFGDWTLPITDADRGDSNFYLGLGKALLGAHMLLSTIVIVNLLVALMSTSYENTIRYSDMEFNATRVKHVAKFLSASSFPPPMNLLTIGWCCVRMGYRRSVASCSGCCCCCWGPQDEIEVKANEGGGAVVRQTSTGTQRRQARFEEKLQKQRQHDAVNRKHRERAGMKYGHPALLPLRVQEVRRVGFVRHRAMRRYVDDHAID